MKVCTVIRETPCMCGSIYSSFSARVTRSWVFNWYLFIFPLDKLRKMISYKGEKSLRYMSIMIKLKIQLQFYIIYLFLYQLYLFIVTTGIQAYLLAWYFLQKMGQSRRCFNSKVRTYVNMICSVQKRGLRTCSSYSKYRVSKLILLYLINFLLICLL